MTQQASTTEATYMPDVQNVKKSCYVWIQCNRTASTVFDIEFHVPIRVACIHTQCMVAQPWWDE